MLFFGKRNQNSIIGVDIGSTAVKVLEISVEQSRFKVERYGTAPLPEKAVADKTVVDPEAVGLAISRARHMARIKSKSAATAVSGSAVITKVIDMEQNMTDNDREMQIRLDADQYIPYPLAEVNLDFEVMGPAEGVGRVQVLLAASRSENIENRVEALSVGGFDAKVVDVEAYAIERACSLVVSELPGSPEVVAVFDIGHTSSTLMVLHHGSMIYTREQAFGGAQLVEDVRRRYGMTQTDALSAIVSGELPDDYQSEILHPFCEALVQQISRSLQFFYSANKFNDVDHILLTGGCARIASLVTLVQERVGNRISVANPFLRMSFGADVNPSDLEHDVPVLLIACGLALRSFD